MGDTEGRADAQEAAAQVAGLLRREVGTERSDGPAAPALASFTGLHLRMGLMLWLSNILDYVNDFEPRGAADKFLTACESAASRWDGTSELIAGYFWFACLNVRLLERRLSMPDDDEQEQTDAYCHALLGKAGVKAAICDVYDPSKPPIPPFLAATRGYAFTEPSPRVLQLWSAIDPNSLSYYKAGTTSFILRCHEGQEDQSGHAEDWVLKCVLFPWNSIGSLVEATSSYAETYGEGKTSPVVVHPEASTANLIIMPFQDGDTLYEHLQRFEQGEPKPDFSRRLLKAEAVAKAVVRALDILANEGPVDPALPQTQHRDLSPGNIIIERDRKKNSTGQDGAVRGVRFIDLGRNHLYSRQVGLSEHDDSVYVAREVRNRETSPTADVYSLGIILVRILTGAPPRDGRVPDEVYRQSPILGRFLEDLLDDDASKRLLLLGDDSALDYGTLEPFMLEVFALAHLEPAAHQSAARRWFARIQPSSGQPSSLLQQWWRHRRSRPEFGYLSFYSLLAGLAFTYSIIVVARWDWQDLAAGRSLDPIPTGMELAAIIMAFNQSLTVSKFYQTILAQLTLRTIPGVLARATEIAMRSTTLVALPTVLLVVYRHTELWAWSLAAGAMAITLTNLLTLRMARRLSAEAAKVFSTVAPPDEDFPGGGYGQWWGTMLLYAFVILIIAAGLHNRWLEDLDAYVVGLVLINLGVHYISKCVLGGPTVRGGLARAFVAGERLRCVWQRGRRINGWPDPPLRHEDAVRAGRGRPRFSRKLG